MVCCSTASFRTEVDHFCFVLLLLNLNIFYLQKNESFASKEKGPQISTKYLSVPFSLSGLK